ncbi:ATP-grasp domain-containing protein [Peptococcaceae bacterium]|nr:ATP-grasp domain-containing protein [Peptococcaceae bacterium]
MKKALILGGSHRDIPLIMAAKKLGFFVITLGDRDYYIGHKFSDKNYKIDFTDLEKVSKVIEAEKIDVLIPGCGEKALLNTVILGKKYKIGNFDSLEAVNIIHDKWKFKEFCQKRVFINVPKGVKITSCENTVLKNISLPCIVKPLNLSGGRGVCVVKSKDGLKSAVKHALEVSENNEVLIEEFIEGKLLACSVFVRNGQIGYSFVGKDDVYLNKYLVSSAYPIEIKDEVLGKLKQNVEKIIADLSLKDGPFHLQFILKDDIPYIIDVTRRIPEDLYPYLIEFSTGIRYSEAVVKAYIGDNIDSTLLKEKEKKFIIRHCIMSSKNGVLKDILVDKEVKGKIIYELYLMEKGTNIDNYLRQQIGIVFFEFNSEKEMIKAAKKINELIFPVIV